MKDKVTIAIVPGAEDGVGPELLIKALSIYNPLTSLQFYWCGDLKSLRLAVTRNKLHLTLNNNNQALINGFNIPLSYSEDYGEQSILVRQAHFLKTSVRLAKKSLIEAIVTGPINKEALRYLDNGEFCGQTEYFAKHLSEQGQKPFMAFLGGPFILTLLTTHQPLASVPHALTSESIVEHLTTVARYGQKIKKKPCVKITVLGLNPHAGEGGLLGFEEDQIILPAIKQANKLGLNVLGPVSADGFFAYLHKIPKEDLPDIVVAMYHDQGLIPYKLLTKGAAVNVTFGLNVVRTSPAHGTATELTGKNFACVKSTAMALKTAIELAVNL